MNVPLRLRRIAAPPSASPLASGFWLRARDWSLALKTCHALGLAPEGRMFDPGDGLLLVSDVPLAAPRLPAGTIRLRAIGPNLFLPVDAELVPSLLADEVRALGRHRGFVFLPDGRVLNFAPDRPLDPIAALSSPPVRRGGWLPLPERPHRPDQIRELIVEIAPKDLSQPRPPGKKSDREDGKREAARPAKRGLPGWNPLGRARPTDPPVRSPKQTRRLRRAALKSLLRDFRAGRVESALERALPLTDDPAIDLRKSDQGCAELPRNRVDGSLGSLLRSPLAGPTPGGCLFGWLGRLFPAPGGRGAAWKGVNDYCLQLQGEYRKAAREAEARGDVRKAAWIHNHLLDDPGAAAQVLARGGFHHDAAVLIEKRKGDLPQAAAWYELAGDFDRAIELFRRIGMHERAGDLLRRLGDEDAAANQYRAAADQLAARGDALAAGLLIRAKLGKPAEAISYFEAGWEGRPAPEAVACAMQLIEVRAETRAFEALEQLARQAESTAFLDELSETSQALIFNRLAEVAERLEAVDAESADALRDRALMTLSNLLRERLDWVSRPCNLISELFRATEVDGSPEASLGAWDLTTVQDADQALKTELDRRRRDRLPAESESDHRGAAGGRVS